VHDTPAREPSLAGPESGVACSRQRLPSQPIAPVPAPTPPTAVQAVDTHDTAETMPENGVGWTDQTAARTGLAAARIKATARTTPTLRLPDPIAASINPIGVATKP